MLWNQRWFTDALFVINLDLNGKIIIMFINISSPIHIDSAQTWSSQPVPADKTSVVCMSS